MSLGKTLAAELQYEALSTRKMLQRVPDEKFDWQPHEKSMTLGQLATHLAEVPLWVRPTLMQDELDFSKNIRQPLNLKSSTELVSTFDKFLSDAFNLLQEVSDKEILKTWKLSDGEKVLLEMPRLGVVRSMVLNHLIHHRGQLSVYLRLNDVSLPSVYGPTADEQ